MTRNGVSLGDLPRVLCALTASADPQVVVDEWVARDAEIRAVVYDGDGWWYPATYGARGLEAYAGRFRWVSLVEWCRFNA